MHHLLRILLYQLLRNLQSDSNAVAAFFSSLDRTTEDRTTDTAQIHD
jgi:hypothetical protein